LNAVLALVDASDRKIWGRLSVWRPPRWFRIWMISATRLGDGWLWVGIAVLLVLGPYQRILLVSALAAALSNTAVVVLKRRFRRQRPVRFLPQTNFFAFDHFSFPSGHTLNAFAIGSVLALQLPVLAAPLLLVALSIGFSRVALGFHFLSDVLVGAFLGIVIGSLVFFIAS